MKLVADAMNRAVSTIDHGLSLREAAVVLRRSGAEHLLVLEGDNLVGILWGCDLRGARPDAAVSERMSLPARTLRPDAGIEEAAATMADCRVGCLPVTLGGLVLGTLCDADLERAGVEPSASCTHAHPHRHRRRPRRAVES